MQHQANSLKTRTGECLRGLIRGLRSTKPLRYELAHSAAKKRSRSNRKARCVCGRRKMFTIAVITTSESVYDNDLS